MRCRMHVALALVVLGPRMALAQQQQQVAPSALQTASGEMNPTGAKDSADHARSSAARPRPASTPRDSAYLETEVDSISIIAPGSPTPAYPDALAVAHIEGTVIARFVVDTNGRVEANSIRIVKTSNAVLSKAVREALPSMRFEPAWLHGRAVRQVVEQPFTFTLP